MALVIEISAAPHRFTVAKAQRLTVGRTEAARLTVAQDASLDDIHFLLDYDGAKVRLENASKKGTLVNGERADKAELGDGGRITAGRTTFLLHTPVPPDKVTGEVLLGSWSIKALPEGWELLEGFGFRRKGGGEFVHNVAFTEDLLEDGQTLDAYLERQQLGLRAFLEKEDVSFEKHEPARVAGAEETLTVSVQTTPPGGPEGGVLQWQIYARRERLLGVVTATFRPSENAEAERFLRALAKALELRPAAPPPPEPAPPEAGTPGAPGEDAAGT